MPSVECPECHMPSANALGKTYCPQCGWNREAAEKQTRLLLKLLPVLVIVFDAPLIVWIFIGRAEILMLALFGLLAIVPAILVVLVVRGKVRLGIMTGETPKAVTAHAGATTISAPTEEVAEQYAVIAEMSRPRTVRMSRQGKRNVTVIILATLAFVGGLIAIIKAQPQASPRNAIPVSGPVVYILPLALAMVIAGLLLRALEQQSQLLSNGDLAMARVTRQWNSRNGYGIHYEFTTPAGEIFSRMTTDNARELSVGMTVPIFYDRQSPKKQVALCASSYEIVLPGQN